MHQRTKLALADRVFGAISKIPSGKVSTYQEVARQIGNTKAYRAVGNALNGNQNTPAVPCHRIIRSDGQVGGYRHGQEVKIKLLVQEGIEVDNGKVVNLARYLYNFKNK
jgi:methylated-DNA-[protein]-cysteine S-methyltransferase